ncbi:hypothetical protein FKM82_030585 [Ascaphus truei]
MEVSRQETARLQADEMFEAEHRLQNQLQGLRTHLHLQYAKEKQQTLQEEKLQAAKEVQALQERLNTQYIPTAQYEELKATLHVFRASLEAELRYQVTLYEREREKAQKLEQELERQRDCSIPLSQYTKEKTDAAATLTTIITELQNMKETLIQIPPIRKKVLALPKHQYPTVTNARENKGTVRVGDSTQLQNKNTTFEPPKKALAKPTAAQQTTNRGRSAESLAEEAELVTPWCGEAAERPLQEQKTPRASPNCSTTVAIHFVYKKRSARRNRNLKTAQAIRRLYVEKVPLE